MTGSLYLIPVPLGPVSPETCLPPDTLAVARRLDHFVVERAKTARAHLKAMGHPQPIQALHLEELNEHTPATAIATLLAPLKAGHDVGLLSEAGCPAVADPGAALVLAAHRADIRVVPLIGPSSILLALMASGLGGQRFAFHGYLPAKEPERSQAIRELEKTARRDRATQLFIETPYRSARPAGRLGHRPVARHARQRRRRSQPAKPADPDPQRQELARAGRCGQGRLVVFGVAA